MKQRHITARFGSSLLLPAIIGLLVAPSGASAQLEKLGETIATKGTIKGVAACIGCHGAKGEGNAAAGFPRLAGLSKQYLSEQLAAFAAGTRQNTIMQPFAKAMSPTGRLAVSEYFSKLPMPVDIHAVDSDPVQQADQGAWLATRGRWEQGLPACAQCHGPGGSGVSPTFPPLAGQPAAYIANQLHAWKNGTRPPGPLALMPLIASKLSDSDITVVAAYYASKAGTPAITTSGSK